MKKLLNSLLLILVLVSLSACKSDMDSLEDGNHRSQGVKNKPMVKTVRMSFGGDFITESEGPLLRAEEGSSYAAINVWRTEKDGGNASEEKYAYGLFKDTENISIDVVTGFTYRFEATIVNDYVDKIVLLNKSYVDPFRIHTKVTPDFDNAAAFQGKINEFIYSSYLENVENYLVPNSERNCFCQLSDGRAYVNAGSDYSTNTILRYPRVKRFYGNLGNFDPGCDDCAEIDMKYKCFGLEVNIEELPSGHVTIEDATKYNDGSMTNPLLFTKDLTLNNEKENVWKGLFSMNKLKAESETFTLKFTWHKGGNVTEVFSREVIVKPKINKILKLKITGSPNYDTKGNIILDTESEELLDEEQEVSADFN